MFCAVLFEMDRVLYLTLIPPGKQRKYEELAARPCTPLGMRPVVDSIVWRYAWLIVLVEAIVVLVAYYDEALKTADDRLSRLIGADARIGLRSVEDFALMQWLRSVIHALIVLHCHVRTWCRASPEGRIRPLKMGCGQILIVVITVLSALLSIGALNVFSRGESSRLLPSSLPRATI